MPTKNTTVGYDPKHNKPGQFKTYTPEEKKKRDAAATKKQSVIS